MTWSRQRRQKERVREYSNQLKRTDLHAASLKEIQRQEREIEILRLGLEEIAVGAHNGAFARAVATGALQKASDVR